jgi:superoxide dismutase, Cu-Zn family
MIRIPFRSPFVVASLAAAVLPALAAADPEGALLTAKAKIAGCTSTTIAGSARLIERPSTEGIKLVDVIVDVTGLPDGPHAVHIHEVGACTPCSAAGGHFDPGPSANPVPDGNHPFHSGDLVNLQVKNGRGTLHTTTSGITLSPGPLSVFDQNGSAIVIHANPDTYCPDGPVSGCAGGPRAACGVVLPANPSD